MGWLFSKSTKKDMIQRITDRSVSTNCIHETLTSCIRGNVLWTVTEMTFLADGDKYKQGQKHRYIGCFLLQGSGGEWGYKDMDESMHPYYYSCPLSYLRMVPVANAEWREKVVRHHQKRQEARQRRQGVRLIPVMGTIS